MSVSILTPALPLGFATAALVVWFAWTWLLYGGLQTLRNFFRGDPVQDQSREENMYEQTSNMAYRADAQAASDATQACDPDTILNDCQTMHTLKVPVDAAHHERLKKAVGIQSIQHGQVNAPSSAAAESRSATATQAATTAEDNA
jgi:hypothetical protein